jgi:hypothetical protein
MFYMIAPEPMRVLCIVVACGAMFGQATPVQKQAGPSQTSEVAAASSWDQAIARALASYRQGHYIEAEADYRAAEAIASAFEARDPRRVHTWNCLCSIYCQLGLPSEAESFCFRALAAGGGGAEEIRLNSFYSLHLLVATRLQSGQKARVRALMDRLESVAESLPELPAKFRGMLSYDRAFLDLLEGRLQVAEAGFLKRFGYLSSKAMMEALKR